MLRTIDYSPLTTPVTPAEVKAFKTTAQTRPQYGLNSTAGQVIGIVVGIVVVGFFVLGFGGVLLAAFSSVAQSGAGIGAMGFPIVLVGIVFLGVFVLIIVVAIRGITGSGGRWERWYRLDRFATANGFVFSPRDANPQYPGSIFSTGRARSAYDHFRSASDRFVDYGNYVYVTGSGKNSTTHRWGFLAFQLDRALPQMVLDSKANNGMFGGTNLPAIFQKDQVLSLEGDFDKYFTLYCPKEYERDALYVFTPDLMALLIDNAAPFDVEIVDKWMFVYSASVFDLRQPAVHQRLLRIVDTVGSKTLTQTDRYSDEHVGDFSANIVAPQGQRLKRGFSIGAVIFLAVFAVLWIWPFIAGLVASFLR